MDKNPKLTEDEREKIKCMLECLAKDWGCAHSGKYLSCERCKQLTMADKFCDGAVIEDRAKALQRVLDEQPKPLAFMMPESLSDEKREWLETSVEAGKCLHNHCGILCGLWLGSLLLPCYSLGEDDTKGVFLNMFRAILAHHKLPLLNYSVPWLSEEEAGGMKPNVWYYYRYNRDTNEVEYRSPNDPPFDEITTRDELFEEMAEPLLFAIAYATNVGDQARWQALLTKIDALQKGEA